MKWKPTDRLGAKWLRPCWLALVMRTAGQRAAAVHLGWHPSVKPIGWLEFCAEYAPECEPRGREARDVAGQGLKDLVRSTNGSTTRSPITDLEHWGVVER